MPSKDVIIQIKNTQYIDGQLPETITTTTEGSFWNRGDYSYLLYEETDDEGAKTNSRLKLSQNGLELKKSGASLWEPRFIVGSNIPSVYHTPYGKLPMSVDTKSFHLKEENDRLEIDLRYDLYIQDELQSSCHMVITVQSK